MADGGLQQKHFQAVSLLGSNSLFGRASSLLLKQSNKIKKLCLYDENNVDSANDVDVINTSCRVEAFLGKDRLNDAVKDADIVLIGDESLSTPHTAFDLLAPKICDYAKAIATSSPNAIVVIAASPINILVPLLSEALEDFGCYDCNKIIGATAVDNSRASCILAARMKLSPLKVTLPVIGGASKDTRVPLISHAKPSFRLSDETLRGVIHDINASESAIFTVKNSPEALNKAFSTVKLLNSVIDGLNGEPNIVNIAFSRTPLVSDVEYFALPVQFGRFGIHKRYGLPRVHSFEDELINISVNNLKRDVEQAKQFYKSKENVPELKRPNHTVPKNTENESFNLPVIASEQLETNISSDVKDENITTLRMPINKHPLKIMIKPWDKPFDAKSFCSKYIENNIKPRKSPVTIDQINIFENKISTNTLVTMQSEKIVPPNTSLTSLENPVDLVPHYSPRALLVEQILKKTAEKTDEENKIQDKFHNIKIQQSSSFLSSTVKKKKDFITIKENNSFFENSNEPKNFHINNFKEKIEDSFTKLSNSLLRKSSSQFVRHSKQNVQSYNKLVSLKGYKNSSGDNSSKGFNSGFKAFSDKSSCSVVDDCVPKTHNNNNKNQILDNFTENYFNKRNGPNSFEKLSDVNRTCTKHDDKNKSSIKSNVADNNSSKCMDFAVPESHNIEFDWKMREELETKNNDEPPAKHDLLKEKILQCNTNVNNLDNNNALNVSEKQLMAIPQLKNSKGSTNLFQEEQSENFEENINSKSQVSCSEQLNKKSDFISNVNSQSNEDNEVTSFYKNIRAKENKEFLSENDNELISSKPLQTYCDPVQKLINNLDEDIYSDNNLIMMDFICDNNSNAVVNNNECSNELSASKEGAISPATPTSPILGVNNQPLQDGDRVGNSNIVNDSITELNECISTVNSHKPTDFSKSNLDKETLVKAEESQQETKVPTRSLDSESNIESDHINNPEILKEEHEPVKHFPYSSNDSKQFSTIRKSTALAPKTFLSEIVLNNDKQLKQDYKYINYTKYPSFIASNDIKPKFSSNDIKRTPDNKHSVPKKNFGINLTSQKNREYAMSVTDLQLPSSITKITRSSHREINNFQPLFLRERNFKKASDYHIDKIRFSEKKHDPSLSNKLFNSSTKEHKTSLGEKCILKKRIPTISKSVSNVHNPVQFKKGHTANHEKKNHFKHQVPNLNVLNKCKELLNSITESNVKKTSNKNELNPTQSLISFIHNKIYSYVNPNKRQDSILRKPKTPIEKTSSQSRNVSLTHLSSLNSKIKSHNNEDVQSSRRIACYSTSSQVRQKPPSRAFVNKMQSKMKDDAEKVKSYENNKKPKKPRSAIPQKNLLKIIEENFEKKAKERKIKEVSQTKHSRRHQDDSSRKQMHTTNENVTKMLPPITNPPLMSENNNLINFRGAFFGRMQKIHSNKFSPKFNSEQSEKNINKFFNFRNERLTPGMKPLGFKPFTKMKMTNELKDTQDYVFTDVGSSTCSFLLREKLLRNGKLSHKYERWQQNGSNEFRKRYTERKSCENFLEASSIKKLYNQYTKDLIPMEYPKSRKIPSLKSLQNP